MRVIALANLSFISRKWSLNSFDVCVMPGWAYVDELSAEELPGIW